MKQVVLHLIDYIKDSTLYDTKHRLFGLLDLATYIVKIVSADNDILPPGFEMVKAMETQYKVRIGKHVFYIETRTQIKDEGKIKKAKTSNEKEIEDLYEKLLGKSDFGPPDKHLIDRWKPFLLQVDDKVHSFWINDGERRDEPNHPRKLIHDQYYVHSYEISPVKAKIKDPDNLYKGFLPREKGFQLVLIGKPAKESFKDKGKILNRRSQSVGRVDQTEPFQTFSDFSLPHETKISDILFGRNREMYAQSCLQSFKDVIESGLWKYYPNEKAYRCMIIGSEDLAETVLDEDMFLAEDGTYMEGLTHRSSKTAQEWLQDEMSWIPLGEGRYHVYSGYILANAPGFGK